MKLITLKQYAKDQKISYEAVRKQVTRYYDELSDHIIKQNRTQFLDPWAVEFLTKRRRESPVVMVTVDQEEEIKRLQEDNEALKAKLLAAQAELLKEKDRVIAIQAEVAKVIEDKAKYTALLEDSKAKEERLTDALKEVEDLRRERDAAQAEAQSFTKSILGFYRKK